MASKARSKVKPAKGAKGVKRSSESEQARAVKHLEHAQKHEQELRFALARQEYEKGLELLLEAINRCNEPHRKKELREHARCFMDKAEKVKQKLCSSSPLTISKSNKGNGRSRSFSKVNASMGAQRGRVRPTVTGVRSSLARRRQSESSDSIRAQIESEILSSSPGVGVDEIVGLGDIKRALYETIVLPYKQPEMFTGLRAPPKAILMFGPPGNGKTMIAKAVASASSATFFSVSASTLTSKFLGQGEKLVKTLFEVAAERAPSVIFIDEIDSLLSMRGGSEHEASRRLKTEFLVRLDGVNSNATDQVLVLAATNLPALLDEAVLRRFARRFYIPLPEAITRHSLISSLMKQHNHRHSVSDSQLRRLVRATEGYSASDIHELCKEAAMGPVREAGIHIEKMSSDELKPINIVHFEQALNVIHPCVSKESLQMYDKWDREHGTKLPELAKDGAGNCLIQ